MKCLVKPKTPSLFLLDRGEVIEAFRPSLVTVTAVVNSKLAAGDLTLLGANIPDTATDADFLAHWLACRENGKVDTDFAVSSFMSRFNPVEIPLTPAKVPPVETPEVPEVPEAPVARPVSKKHGK